jgi:hypothetical protein
MSITPPQDRLPGSGFTFLRIRLMKTILQSTFLALSLSFTIPMAFSQDVKLPAIQSAAYDDTGRILVNGKPFFPIMIYDAPADDATLKLLREQSFNVMTIGKPEQADLLMANGFYGALHAGPKDVKTDGILFGIGMDSPALNWKDNLIKQAIDDCAKVKAGIPGRLVFHAIGYWLNEPQGVKDGTLPPKDKYEDLVQAIEVAAPYLYPVPYQPISTVGDAVGRAKTATGGKKPVLPVLQLFTWEAKDRYPTPAELKCMVYLSLINGANGIGYYSYGYVSGKPANSTTIAKEQPELWKAAGAANKEILVIAGYLADGTPNDAIKLGDGTPEIKMRAVQHTGGGVILLANTAAAAKSASLQLPATITSLKRLDGGKEIAVAGGKATVELQPSEAVGLQY